MRSLPLRAMLLVAGVGCSTEAELYKAIQNTAPVAKAGDDLRQSADQPVNLNGGGSYDPDGDAITFHWGFDYAPAGSAYAGDTWTLPNNHSTEPTTGFLPDLPGTYVVQLYVEDGAGAQSPVDTVLVDVLDGTAPVADAGPDLSGADGDLFTLDGSRSFDPYSRDLRYEWTFSSVPSSSALTALTSADTAVSSFVADVGGVYVVSLVVDNGLTRSTPDVAVVRVIGDPGPPEAVLASSASGEDCSAIPVDGSGSFDPNGDPLRYKWWLEDAPNGSRATDDNFADPSSAATTFYPDIAGTYTLALSVSDGESWSTPALMELVADERAFNTAPTVDAGTGGAVDAGTGECRTSGYSYVCSDCADQIVPLGADAVVGDADGDALQVRWELLSTSSAVITDPAALSTTAELSDVAPTAPSACESVLFEFQLTATDCTGATSTDIVSYTVSCCGVTAP
jgi:hypothetical protein